MRRSSNAPSICWHRCPSLDGNCSSHLRHSLKIRSNAYIGNSAVETPTPVALIRVTCYRRSLRPLSFSWFAILCCPLSTRLHRAITSDCTRSHTVRQEPLPAASACKRSTPSRRHCAIRRLIPLLANYVNPLLIFLLR